MAFKAVSIAGNAAHAWIANHIKLPFDIVGLTVPENIAIPRHFTLLSAFNQVAIPLNWIPAGPQGLIRGPFNSVCIALSQQVELSFNYVRIAFNGIALSIYCIFIALDTVLAALDIVTIVENVVLLALYIVATPLNVVTVACYAVLRSWLWLGCGLVVWSYNWGLNWTIIFLL